MEHQVARLTGWIVSANDAWIFFWVWLAVVLVYGFRRSLGDAPQDPIRPSGPTGDA